MSKPTDNNDRLSRRSVLQRTAAALSLLAVSPDVRTWLPTPHTARPYLDAALKAERWIARSAIRDARGTRWPADPDKPASVSTDLYLGSAGVVLFYLELCTATDDEMLIARAASGADYLMSTLPSDATQLGADGAGLYTGIAGIAYVLDRAQATSGRAEYGAGARRAITLLRNAATTRGNGVVWNDSNDIISGSAGIGLTMLWANEALRDSAALDTAIAAGRRLVEVARPASGGLEWDVSPQTPKRYPNFSHGTAGVAYFLASLYAKTQQKSFLDAAIAGASYLQGIAKRTANDGRRVFHSVPGGEELFYLSWCHGPAGTARLFHRLGQVTGNTSYNAWVPQLAQAIVDGGVPDAHPDLSGYWNNISQCCGNCGVSDFFLSLHSRTNDAAHLAFATRVADNTLARATSDGEGLKWIQAENRVQPTNLVAQTGLMQGAAGVGLSLLRLDATLNHWRPTIRLPDAPQWT